MSQIPGDLPEIPASGEAPQAAPRRAASVTLRGEEDQATLMASMDPAQRSLADALRITFFLLQIGMAALLVLFLFSGMRQVRESERGVRLTFGRIVEQDIPPGLHFSWPFPVGDFVTLETGLATADIDTSYWPRLSSAQLALKPEDLAKQTTITATGLRPGDDGGLITGDGNLVHAQWSIQYRRTDPAAFLRNLNQIDERQIVISAVQRGIVRVFAEKPIDALLRQNTGSRPASATEAPSAASLPTPTAGAAPSGESAPAGQAQAQAPSPPQPAQPVAPTPAPAPQQESTLSSRIRQVAQQTLNDMGAGITIDQVVMKNSTPPFPVLPAFTKVQSAESEAAKGREEAERQRRERLNAVAGQAHPVLLERINAYERAVEAGRDAESEEVLAQIDRLLEGEPVEIGGRQVGRLVSGEVTDIIGRAKNYTAEVVSRSRTSMERFQTKLAQYRANPSVLVNREWTEAYLGFFELPTSQVMLLPPGSQPDLWLNPDPEFLKQQEVERNSEQIQRTIKERLADMERRQARNADRRNAGNQPGQQPRP